MFPKPLMSSGSMGTKKLEMGQGQGAMGGSMKIHLPFPSTGLWASGFSYLNLISMMDGWGTQITLWG